MTAKAPTDIKFEEKVGHLLLAILVIFFNADRSSIMLYDPATKTLKTRAVVGKGSEKSINNALHLKEKDQRIRLQKRTQHSR